MTIAKKILAILSCIFVAHIGLAKSTIDVKKFAISPDKQLTLYREIGCETNVTCQVFYRVNQGNIQKVDDLEMVTSSLPEVRWHNHLAQLTTLSGTDTTLSTFIDAKRGVYQMVNMAQFDPIHECLLASDNRGKGLSFFRLFDNQPREMDLDGLNVDKDGVFPIHSLVSGGDNKFLDNGDFQFDYFDKNHTRKLAVIHNPCNNN